MAQKKEAKIMSDNREATERFCWYWPKTADDAVNVLDRSANILTLLRELTTLGGERNLAIGKKACSGLCNILNFVEDMIHESTGLIMNNQREIKKLSKDSQPVKAYENRTQP